MFKTSARFHHLNSFRLLVVSLCLCQMISAQAIMAPPFGLQWGDTPDKILDWAEKQKLDVIVRMPGKQPELRDFRVSAENAKLPGHEARALEARFQWGKLYEVTLHYGSENNSAEGKLADLKVDFEKLKAAMSLKYGVLKPNNKKEVNEDGYVQKSISYYVEPVSGLLLMMIYTELDDSVRGENSARFSLLYRNHNIKLE